MVKDKDYVTERKEEVRRLNKDGEVEVHYRIWATSKGGTYFHVEVSEADLGGADELLTARARQLDSI